ncbi:MAG TPA: RNA polymerase sigma factor [Urbifossiella sp.]|nr:RNA polymerase sigma factor [Urbifossiella sp.]
MSRVEPTLLAARILRIASEEALTDAELAGRYAEHRDAAAFEVLVWRQGPMVWGTCHRVLRHQQDAEDAFQATFLALARAAGTLGSRQAVAGWLHRVAMNSALNMKARHRLTGLTDDVSAPLTPDGELSGAVDEELERLPHRMRAAFVLCCLEGMTNAEAARELGCPVGTVDSRLHAARTRLRDRLTRRGLGPTAILVGATWAAPSATATLPAPWVMSALRHATAHGAIPNNINRLATGVLKSMCTSRLKSSAAPLIVFGALMVGGGFGHDHLTGQPPGASPPAAISAPSKGDPTPPTPMGVSAPKPAPFVTAWGRPVAGLQAGVRVRADQLRLEPGRALEIEVVVRNIRGGGNVPSTIRLSGYNSDFVCHVKDGVAEVERNPSYNGPTPTFTRDIDTGGQTLLGSIAVETVPNEPAEVVINRRGMLYFQWKPGTYRVGGENIHMQAFPAQPAENWPAVKRDERKERENTKLGTGYLDVEVIALRPANPANAAKRE